MTAGRWRLEALRCAPLAVPLRDPFVIASGRVDVTPNVLLRLTVRDLDSGRVVEGLGEAATLPPVTAETQAAVLASLRALRLPLDLGAGAGDVGDADTAAEAHGASLGAHGDGLGAHGDGLGPCARAGLDMALHDAVGQLRGAPVHRLLRPGSATPAPWLTSDITLAIAAPETMATWAGQWRARGFSAFKVKVGSDRDADLRALRAIVQAVPDATLRLDANGGYDLPSALRMVADIERHGLPVTCFEQPCATDDIAAMAAVRRATPYDVLADESCKSVADLQRLLDADAVDGVNLKLVKSGGLRHCLAIATLARAAGLSLMVGAMVETRLGIAAALQLATAVGGVEFPDLDTAWLLAGDPFVGGYEVDGARLRAVDAPGLGLRLGEAPAPPATTR